VHSLDINASTGETMACAVTLPVSLDLDSRTVLLVGQMFTHLRYAHITQLIPSISDNLQQATKSASKCNLT